MEVSVTIFPISTSNRPKWRRKSLRKKKAEESSDPDGKLRKKRVEAEALQLYKNTRDELTQRLEHLSSRGRYVPNIQFLLLITVERCVFSLRVCYRCLILKTESSSDFTTHLFMCLKLLMAA